MKIQILSVNNSANDETAKAYQETLLRSGAIAMSNNAAAADPDHKLWLCREAVREIRAFIEWDVGPRPDIRAEQGGILLGKRYYDAEKGIHFAVVSKAVTADGAAGSSGYLDISEACWQRMHAEKDAYDRETGADAVIVGWFHTHPNLLSCFMSGTDSNTQDLFFNGDNTYSIVINPQRHLIKAFRARECHPAQAFFDCGPGRKTGE